jgi:broad specificity phosphatase PhoE
LGEPLAKLFRDMTHAFPHVYLARHGETAWSLSGQHTGLTDLPLTENGQVNARRLGERLRGLKFARVFTSPLQRAAKTCELAGFGAVAETDPELVEWNYGDYEGLRREEILMRRPGWQIFRDGCPGGESAPEAAARADRVLQRLRDIEGDVLIFSSGHFLRMFAARWLALDAMAGNCFLLSTASLSILGYGHDLTEPAVELWNDTRHVGGVH